MINRLTATVLAALMFLPAPKARALDDSVSGWVGEGAAKMRLIAGAPAPDGSLRAGLEIRLQPGWKTYWINPGPTGLPPRLEASGANLAHFEPLWPLPKRIEDGGGSAVGYSGSVIVPLKIAPKDAAKPVPLHVRFSYGLCEKICVPAETAVSLTLSPGQKPDAFAAAQLAVFEGRVPRPATLGDAGPLSIVSAARTAEGLEVEVRTPEGAQTRDLFASAPGTMVGVPRKLGEGRYRIKLKAGRPLPKEVHLMAVADNKAIEVRVALDDLPSKP